MKAQNLKLEELVEFGDGAIDFHGRRLVLHSMDAFAQQRRDLLDMLGGNQSRRILTRFGYFWGQADAAAMRRLFKWDSALELVKAGPRLHAIQGVARWVVKSLQLDEVRGRLEMEVTWHDSGEAHEHLAQLGRATEPVCWMLVGYASGFVSFALDRNVYFVETGCRACGQRVCSAVGKDAATWGPALAAHLPFFNADDIQGRIRSLTTELRRTQRELDGQRRMLAGRERTAFVEVRSRSFERVLELATRIAPFDSSVLITGESGVGKEVLARHIHSRSRRARGAFLAVNCGALPENLLDTELFGHKAGAFTGAVHDRVGLFEEANGGTLFLDEVGEVSPGMQVKLLRVLQEREITRVGESRPRKVDVRVVAATNRDLAKMMSAGSFRDDLYYRLRVIEIAVPPLRERVEDIVPLARFFVERTRTRLGLSRLQLDATAIDALLAHDWPGNVRELENAVEHAAVLSRDGVIRPESLPASVARRSATPAPGPATAGAVQRTLAEVEHEHILRVLEHAGGHRAHAAQILGISTATLWRRLRDEPPEPAAPTRSRGR